jgi:hypothetical protein
MVKEKWIQKAINPKHKGKLRRKVQAKYGKSGFTERGTIKVDVLKELKAEGTPQEQKQANLALNLHDITAESAK